MALYGDSPPRSIPALLRATPQAQRFARGLIKITSEVTMLSYSITFLIIALVAAVLGFGVIAGTAAGIAKILFLVFLLLFIVSIVLGRRVPDDRF
ncbi:MAG: hypothetical protein NVS9B10_23230 [Nevskia sp.]